MFRIYATIIISLLLFVTNNSFAAISCTLATPNGSFGNYDVFSSTTITTTATVTVTCTNNTSPAAVANLTLTFSAGSSGNMSSRSMKNTTSSTNLFTYNIYKNSTYTQILGNGTSSTFTITSSPTVAANTTTPYNFTIYAQGPSQQNAYIGNYSDPIIVTLTY